MKKYFLLFIAGIFFFTTRGFSDNASILIRNFEQVSESEFAFDAYIVNNSASAFTLFSYQFRLEFDVEILNGSLLNDAEFHWDGDSGLDGVNRPDFESGNAQSASFGRHADNRVAFAAGQWDQNTVLATYLTPDEEYKIDRFRIKIKNGGKGHPFANRVPNFKLVDVIVQKADNVDGDNVTINGGSATAYQNDDIVRPATATDHDLGNRQMAGYAFTGEGDWTNVDYWNVESETVTAANQVPGTTDGPKHVNAIINGNVTIPDGTTVSLTPDEGNGGELTLLTGEEPLFTLTLTSTNQAWQVRLRENHGAPGDAGDFFLTVNPGNTGTIQLPAGYEMRLYADDNDFTGGSFLRWDDSDGTIGTTQNGQNYTMPSKDITVTAILSGVKSGNKNDGKSLPSFNSDHTSNQKSGSLFSSLTIAPGGALTVDKLFNDHEDGAAAIILQSPTGHGAAGSLIHINTGVPVSVQRYIAHHSGADVDGWHLLSAPVSGQDIVPEFFPDAVDGAAYDAVDFYRWDEETRSWLNIKTGTFTHTEFQVGHGYLMAYGTPADKDTWGNRTHTFAGPANVVSITFDNLTLTGEETYTGWHLLGNPFASALNWNNETDWNLTAAGSPHVWDDTANDYKEIATTDVIPAMNGLMIKVTNATNSITLNPANRVHSPQDWYKHQERDDRIRLLARDPSLNSAKGSTVIFRDDALTGIDRYDSYLISGFGPIFFSQVDQVRVSVNALPEYHDGLTIPFGFTRNPVSRGTEFSIELESKLKELEDAGYLLHLHDLKLDVQHNLSQEPVYEFTWQEGDDVNRFLLVFEELDVTGIIDEPLPGDVGLGNAWLYDNMLYVYSVEDGTQVALYDLSGRMLQSWRAQAGQQGRYVDLPSGVYVVRMTGSTATKSVKVLAR